MARIVNSVARALDALDALSKAPNGLTLAALSRRLRVPKSTLHAILGTLTRRSIVEMLPDGLSYRLGPRLAELGLAAGGRRRLVETAHPYLAQLVHETGESAFLGVPAADPLETVYIGKVESPQAIRYSAELGERRPSHATAAGKMLLASLTDDRLRELLRERSLPRLTLQTISNTSALLRELRDIRVRGYALTVDERVAGASGVATLIRHAPGRVAALSLIGPTERLRARLDRHIPHLLGTARQIEAAMGQGAIAAAAAPASASAWGAGPVGQETGGSRKMAERGRAGRNRARV